MRWTAIIVALLGAPSVSAQDIMPPARTIQVTGVGKVATPPSLAGINYWLAGEGKTSDDASRALVARQTDIARGVAGLLGSDVDVTDSNLVVIAVRGPQCPAGYNAPPQLSEGACAIVGYLATMQGYIRTPSVTKAGTAVALISHLGARDARIGGFMLADAGQAQRAALLAAVANARRQATALAAAAGEKLGPVQTIRDQNYAAADTIQVSAPAAPPPPQAPLAVAIDINPRPIETVAQVFVTFAIAP